MDMMQSPEQDEIERTVAAFLTEKFPVRGHGHSFKRTEPEIADELWQECCNLGWLSLGLSEDAGGVGYGLAEEAILFRELGRGLAPGPFLSGVLAAHVAAAAGDHELVAKIISGEVRVALATPLNADEASASFSGDISLVHTERADYAVMITPDKSAIYAMENVAVEQVDSVDISLAVGRAKFDNVHALHLVDSGASSLYERALILAAAISVGMAIEVMRISVEYSKTREQFGKPIGSFQALKTYAAYMASRCELAESQLFFAALAVEARFESARSEALAARFNANEAARMNGEHAIQIHGGYGYTTEYTPYRFVTRNHVIERIITLRSAVVDAI
jgi:alkylation response protein AidB-like acyl-CoA dehydrogenase